MTADIIPIQPEPGDEWEDLAVRVPAPRPRIAPGVYEARSATLRKFTAFKRLNLEIGFDCFRGDAPHGVILARVPLFVRCPGPKGLSPNSKLARLFYLLYHSQNPPRWGRLPVSTLKHKLWRVLVGDATKNTAGEDLPEPLRYSVITQILERLA